MIAENTGQNKPTQAIVRNAFYMFTVLGLIILVLGLILLPFLSSIFHVTGELAQQTTTAYFIVLITMGLTFPSAIFSAVFAGYQEYDIHNGFVIALALLNALGTVIVLSLGWGIVGLAIQSLVVSTLVFFAKMLVVRLRYKVTVGGRLTIDKQLMKNIFNFSKWIFLMNVAVQIVFYTDSVVLGIFSSLAAITFYQVALKPNNFLRNISGQLLTVVMPAGAQLQAQRDSGRVGRLLLEATRITAVILIPFVIVLAAWGRDIITMWVGPEYLSSYPAMVALSIGIFATSLAGASSQILIALNKPAFLAKVAITEAALNLIFSILLVKQFGILGVAIGTTVPTFITATIFAMPYAARLSGVGVWHLYRKMIEPALLGLLFAGGAAWVNYHYHFTNIFTLLGASMILFATFVSVAIMIDPSERHIYRGLIGKVFSR